MGPWKSASAEAYRGSFGGKVGVERMEGAKKRCSSVTQECGLDVCQRSFPWTALSAQSNRSPMWARIWTGWRPAPIELGKFLGRALEGTRGTVGEAGDGVAEQFALFVHGRKL